MAAASAASLCAKLSSLSVNSHGRKPSLLSPHHLPLTTSKIPISLSKPPQKLPPPKANSYDIDFDDTDPEEIPTFSPPEPPEGFVEPPSFDDEPPELEEEIAKAYEERYGPAYSGESYLGNDVYVMDAKFKKSRGLAAEFRIEKIKDGFEEVVVQVRRVTKVVKGGRQMNFRAVVVVGDKKGNVGVGVGKAKEVVDAVRKASLDARREIVTIPMNKVEGDYGAATVMLRPSSVGSGVVAGGVVKTILEMSGLGSGRGKQIGGSKNILNNARATLVAAQQLRLLNDVAEERGIPLEELLK